MTDQNLSGFQFTLAGGGHFQGVVRGFSGFPPRRLFSLIKVGDGLTVYLMIVALETAESPAGI